jgi:predicted phosphoribosyltransferase
MFMRRYILVGMFEAIKNKFQVKFKDRIAAANILAAVLINTITKEELRNNTVSVLGIPRGGAVLADVIATKLEASHFGLVIPRKLTIPNNEEAAFGAIMGDGTIYIDYRIVRDLDITEDYIENEKNRQLQEIERRTTLYAQNKTNEKFVNKPICQRATTTVLVDDGAASGATMIAAARSIRRATATNSKLIIAVPVAPRDTVANLLSNEADHVEVVMKPSSFGSVGQYYKNFEAVNDEKVIDIMEKNRYRHS